MIAAGPPELDLHGRRSLLEILRVEIERCGLRPVEIRGVFRHRVLAVDAEVQTRLERDERGADDHGHWWLDDVVWRSSDGQTVVVYEADPDGNDVIFEAWGPDARRCLESLNRRLAAHHP